ncbi:hypothetical protein [Sporanaerobacter acetigenes]|uniref:CGNR zinc finger domain-containing protein n=1 Tax=Sporanaerobacter acetigenes DSM 13106 TaxID=1123281 RepID=A0A1M5YZU1_9FIRM|nr:hypothetical protein [Sporanaerobacter acetigenes]SHI17526.1 hypothetical protein SAMN02745180_02586 [Sporanaerobacter acetigenes DSM 13106]
MTISDTFKSAFVFESCKCVTDYNEVVNLNTGNKTKSLVVRNDISKKFRAAYIYGEGLKEIRRQRANDKNNILGEFLGIKKNDINSVMSFFNKYGFLFDLSGYDQYVNVNVEDIIYLKDNLEALINLLNAQNTSKVNYKKFLDSALFLLLKEDREIKINDETVYESIHNSFLNNIKNATKTNLIEGDNIVHVPRNDGGKDIAYRCQDSLLESGNYDIIISDYDKILEDDNPHMGFTKQIFKAYVIKNSLFTKDEELAIEFLFHFIKQISSVNLDLISLDMPFADEVYDKIQSEENIYLHDALFKISKFLIERELNYHLSEIRPVYNVETMQPNWNLPSLLSAMYLSLFYLDSRQASYRACQNINCGQFFLVSKTNSIKKYCCVYCTNAVSQRRYRHKKGE